jgi:hypothetical protein
VAVFEWECPTWGCHGGLFMDDQPRHRAVAWCEGRPGDKSPRICGRSMLWNSYLERWIPHPDQPSRPEV